jgi:arylsulfatase
VDDLGITNNTIVLYTTDNGPHMNSWPDGGMTPFRNEKNSNWEGAFRVPVAIRWPGHIQAGQVSNEIVSGLDWFPTLLAAAGDTDITDRLLKGWKLGDMTYKNHLDGYNILPYLEGKEPKPPRKSFFYFNDDGQLVALRYENWKLVFCEQRVRGTLQVWAEPFTCLRLPKLLNLRMDPYERADETSNTYYEWALRHAFLLVPAQALAAQFLATFKDYPPRQRPASFNLDEVVESLQKPGGG